MTDTSREPDRLLHRILGPWNLERRLGAGRHCEVYRASHLHAEDLAAIKVLRADLEDPREGERALAREEEALGLCQHPGIPSFLMRGEVAGRPAIALSFCPGQNVLRLIAQHAPYDRFGVLLALAGLLAHVHRQGLAHGDVCLENILLDPERGRVHLTGFGNARRPLGTGTEVFTRVFRRKTHAGGPLTYLAPELLARSTPTPRGDIYAVGVCSFLMLTRLRPYPAKSKEAIQALVNKGVRADILRWQPRLPRPLASIVNRCVTLDPDQRCEDGQELHDALHLFFAAQGAPRPSDLSREIVPAADLPEREETKDIRWLD